MEHGYLLPKVRNEDAKYDHHPDVVSSEVSLEIVGEAVEKLAQYEKVVHAGAGGSSVAGTNDLKCLKTNIDLAPAFNSIKL